MRSIVIVIALGACGKAGGPSGLTQATLLTERPVGNGLIEQMIDINGDEQPDVFNFFRERSESTRLLVRKEVDLNWDGRIDVRTWFNDDGEIEKEEMDGDFDSRVDWIDHYKGGHRVMSELDTIATPTITHP